MMDKTMPAHTPQNSFDKKSILVMSGEKNAIAQNGQAIDHFVSDHFEAPLTDSLAGIFKEANLSQIKEEALKAKYISHT